MKIKIIRMDGVVRHITTNMEFVHYAWKEGNYACDCNRHIFFERAAGRNAIDDEFECTEHKYSVTIWSDEGEELYSD